MDEIDFTRDNETFLEDVSSIADSLLERNGHSSHIDLAQAKILQSEIIQDYRLFIPSISESYLLYLRNSGSNPPKFLDTTAAPGCINIAAVKANPEQLAGYATLINRQFGLDDLEAYSVEESSVPHSFVQHHGSESDQDDFVVDETSTAHESEPFQVPDQLESSVCERITLEAPAKRNVNVIKRQEQLHIDPSAFQAARPLEDDGLTVVTNLKAARKLLNKRRKFSHQKFFGMPLHKVTPELRREFKMLAVRRFLSSRKQYRGARSSTGLEGQDAGYFVVGKVVEGPSLHESKAKRRSKSITKDLLRSNNLE